MARRRRSRFGVPTVFAGRPSVGEVGLGCQAIHRRARRTWPSRRTESADSQGRPRRQRAPGEDDGKPNRKLCFRALAPARFKHLPSNT